MFRTMFGALAAAVCLFVSSPARVEAQQVIKIRKPDGKRYEDTRSPSFEAEVQRFAKERKAYEEALARLDTFGKQVDEAGRQYDQRKRAFNSRHIRPTPEQYRALERQRKDYNSMLDRYKAAQRGLRQDRDALERWRQNLLNRSKNLTK